MKAVDLKVLRNRLLLANPIEPSSRSVPAWVCWLSKAANLKGKSSVRVTLMLLKLALRVGRHQNLLISRSLLECESINRVTAYQALEDLQQAGLVEVQRRPSRAPLVAIVGVFDPVVPESQTRVRDACSDTK
ncbi:hypothetical protein Q31b_57510 [Novipirellula aureliae]|uniref:Uncharacterized protein n=1 Tax=Novipirellula aureliae TaxID=2527966 RepID=A0A5C6DC53_9BACT|nr:hypothetical protein [Novipirellula aureliae]TWU33434.1 hypothetical protein Q31b_57510 [Novipirellula aureliae]